MSHSDNIPSVDSNYVKDINPTTMVVGFFIRGDYLYENAISM